MTAADAAGVSRGIRVAAFSFMCPNLRPATDNATVTYVRRPQRHREQPWGGTWWNDAVTIHPELARIHAAHALVFDARLLAWARMRYFGSPDDAEAEPTGLKASLSDQGAPPYVRFQPERWRAKSRGRRAQGRRPHDKWADSEWMRALLGNYFLACRPEHPTEDDVKNVLIQGEGYAQAIVDAFVSAPL